MRPALGFRILMIALSLTLSVALGQSKVCFAAPVPNALIEQILSTTPEGLEICSRLLGRSISVAGSEELDRISRILAREEYGTLRAEIEGKAERVADTLERRGIDWKSASSAASLRRTVAAEFMMVSYAAPGEIDFVSGGRYEVGKGGFARAKEAFVSGVRDQAGRAVQAVVPQPVLEGAAKAQRIAGILRDTAGYSSNAAQIIAKEGILPLKWVEPTAKVVRDLVWLSDTLRMGAYGELPEVMGDLLERGEEFYSGMLRTFEKMEPGPRHDAYALVLGDLEQMIKASRQAYEISTRVATAGAPIAIKASQTVAEAARTVEAAGARLNAAIDAAQDKTIGRMSRAVAQGKEMADDVIEAHVSAKYEEVWAQYLSSPNADSRLLAARVRTLQSKNFGIPWPAAGRLNLAARAERLSGMLEWARTIEAPLLGRVTPLTERSHPVMNHFVDVFMRGQGKVAADFLSTGGEWESLPTGERVQAVDAIKKLIDTQATNLGMADTAALRPFVPEIDELKEFCRRWQDLTEIERKIVVVQLLDFRR